MMLIVTVAIIIFKFSSTNVIKINTEFGDQFTILCDDFGDLYDLSDVNSDFSTDLYYYSNKNQLHSVVDNQYIRCYRISDGLENGNKDKYIFKLKEYDKFIAVRYSNVKYSNEYMSENDAAIVKSNYFCDDLLMKISLTDLDHLFHDEMIEVAQKLTSGDYEGLDKYGLTEEMINDKESLDEKVKIMKEYLKENTD